MDLKIGRAEFTTPTLTQHTVEEALKVLGQRGYSIEKSPTAFFINGKEVSAVDLINIAFHGKAL